MKICIYGAGAIGGYLGVKLALAGADVSLIARGRASGGDAGQRAQAPDR
jgi:ketopantoate reductase